MISRVVIICLLGWIFIGMCVLEDKQNEIINKHNEVRLITAKLAIDVLEMKYE